MKKYLLVIFTLLVIYNLTSASNWDLLKPGKRWNVILTGLSSDGGKVDSTTYFYKFEGDTIFNSFKYRRAWESLDENFNNKTLMGFAREDSLVGLYFRRLDGNESMVYKYNLKIGDSLKINNQRFGWLIEYLVIGMDSLQIDGKYKKSYFMQQKIHSYTYETWVEGIGSQFGILNCGLIIMGSLSELLCYYDNNIMLYRNPNYSECYYPRIKTAIDPVRNPKSGIEIYSGTSADFISIKSTVDNSIRIYNSCGVSVETINVQSNQEYSHNISSYPKGIYFVSPTTNLSGTKKFIKF
jgi:hypothetical protein